MPAEMATHPFTVKNHSPIRDGYRTAVNISSHTEPSPNRICPATPSTPLQALTVGRLFRIGKDGYVARLTSRGLESRTFVKMETLGGIYLLAKRIYLKIQALLIFQEK